MLLRIYALVWFLTVGTTATLYLGGFFNEQVLIVLGFLTAMLVFTGIVAVLPWWLNKQYAPKH